MDTMVIKAHLPAPLANEVEDLANRLERSKGWIVKQALILWVAQEEHRHDLTVEALVEVKNEQFVEHQAVQDWVDSLETDKPLGMPCL
jgi:predicted transcriptional regulator